MFVQRRYIAVVGIEGNKDAHVWRWRTLPLLISFAFFISFKCLHCDDYYDETQKTDLTPNKTMLREKAHGMFMHGYTSYMRFAFPHDELMPLSCQGRKRGVTPSRGDVDDALGNFSLTLVDTLDTLVVVGEFDEFARAVRLVVDTVRFDSDLIISVFETNIRMIGGLLSAHLLCLHLKQRDDSDRLHWYSDQLLRMATELADRLLPAFNTSSGVPHARINLRHGLLSHLQRQQDTCTACGGTMILEWATLSRLTGNPIYEDKARKAMDFLWEQRHRGSDLMGTVLNVNSGDWIRRDSGIGAGIDSYYEYTLKAYILLGEEDYLYRFNKHYDSIMRYLSKGPLFIDVHMHKPQIASRSYMDALLAFWPGVQVLKGDLRSAIEMHEMLYRVVKRHKFLPDAFTHDLQVHWAQHPLRPEFIESTYFLYRATRDPHYLKVAEQVINSLEQNVKVRCGFASIKDVRTMEHEDQMESFVLAETFKYLYMIFAEPDELPFHPDNYVLTTEAHFLPLTIGEISVGDENRLPRRMLIDPDEIIEHEASDQPNFASACPNVASESQGIVDILRTPGQLVTFGNRIRQAVNTMLGNIDLLSEQNEETDTCSAEESKGNDRLRAWTFNPSNPEHLAELKMMGIQVEIEKSGFVKLMHAAQAATNAKLALHGLQFIREMSGFINEQHAMAEQNGATYPRRVVQLISSPYHGFPSFSAASAQFGIEFNGLTQFIGEVVLADPLLACTAHLQNGKEIHGRIAVVKRGSCMFEEKARNVQRAGALAMIVIDNQNGTSAESAPFFAMSSVNAENEDDVHLPSVFLFYSEGQSLLEQLFSHSEMVVRLAESPLNPMFCFEQFLRRNPSFLLQQFPIFNQFLALDAERVTLRVNFFFGDVNTESIPEQKQAVVEQNVEWIGHSVHFPNGVASREAKRLFSFLSHMRAIAYSLLGYPNALRSLDMVELHQLVKYMKLRRNGEDDQREQSFLSPPNVAVRSTTTSIICHFRGDPDKFDCSILRKTKPND